MPQARIVYLARTMIQVDTQKPLSSFPSADTRWVHNSLGSHLVLLNITLWRFDVGPSVVIQCITIPSTRFTRLDRN